MTARPLKIARKHGPRVMASLAAMAASALILSWIHPSRPLVARMIGQPLLEAVMADLAGAGITTEEGGRMTFAVAGDPTCAREIRKVASMRKDLAEPEAGAVRAPDVTISCSSDGSTFRLEARAARASAEASRSIPDFRSVLPPVFAVIVALGLRNILAAFLVALWVGVLLARGPGWSLGLYPLVVDYIWATVVDQFSFSILIFTLSLVGMVQIANRAGGGQGLADTISRMAKSARSAKVAATLLGLVIFFDDYSNTVIVGTTIRSLTDRFRVSREKLSFIVDSTSAPVAGIALISTWIGYEVGLFQELSDSLGLGLSGYAIFLDIMPLRFYCYFTILFVLTSSWMERDFGPMLRAERRARETGQLIAPGSRPLVSRIADKILPVPGVRPWWPTMGIPVGVSLLVVVVGMIIVGGQAGGKAADWAAGHGHVSPTYLRLCFEEADSSFVLLVSSLLGSWVAVFLAVTRPFDPTTAAPGAGPRRIPWWEILLPLPCGFLTGAAISAIHAGSLAPREIAGRPDTTWVMGIFLAAAAATAALVAWRLAVQRNRAGALGLVDALSAWAQGFRSMAFAITILIGAWTIRKVCDDLGTSTYIVATLGAIARPWLVPAITFMLASILSFSTGTSWGTMGILIPTLMPFAYHIGGLPTLVLSMGAVLDGAIFGDHCSPLSDTTVLSSIMSGCDHLDHTTTQLPYALACFGVAMVAGYLPLGLGVPVPLLHVAGAVMVFAIVRLAGRKVVRSR